MTINDYREENDPSYKTPSVISASILKPSTGAPKRHSKKTTPSVIEQRRSARLYTNDAENAYRCVRGYFFVLKFKTKRVARVRKRVLLALLSHFLLF